MDSTWTISGLVCGRPLAAKIRATASAIQRVGAQAVHRLGGEGDEAAGTDQCGGALDAPVSLRGLVFVVAGGLAGLAPHEIGVDERVEIAFQDAVDVSDGEAAAQVLHQAVGSEHVVADLAAEVDFELGILRLSGFHALLGEFELVQTRPQGSASTRWRDS